MSSILLKQTVVERVYSEYEESGFVTEDFILGIIAEYDLPLSEVGHICEYIVAKGVVICDETTKEALESTDYSHVDYNQTFDKVVAIDESLSYFIAYIRHIQPPQWREAGFLLPQAQNGNQYARQRMIEMYLRVVVRMALNLHEKYDFTLADLIQEGCIGLTIALDKFKADRQDKFSTYAPWWIRQVVARGCSVGNPMMYFPAHVNEHLFVIYELAKQHSCELCGQADICSILIDEIASKLDCDKDEAIQLMQYIEPFDSMEALSEEDSKLLSDHGAFEMMMYDYVEHVDLKSTIVNKLASLKEREKEIIQYRFGLLGDKPMTLEQVGEIYGITRERIRQIEARAIKKLSHVRALKLLY